MSVNEKNSSVNLKLNSYILFTCLVAGLCVFTINYNFGVVNIPENYIHRCQDSDVQYRLGMSNCVPMTDYFWGYFASIIAFGGFFGCFLAIYLSCRYGRRATLMLHNLGFIAGGIMVSMLNNKYIMTAGRFIIGLSGGISQTVAPLYVAEVAPIRTRGAMGLLAPILGDIGNIASLALSMILSDYFLWRILLGIILIPSIIQLICLMFCVETPRFLIIFKKKYEKGSKSLQKIRKGCDTTEELKQITFNNNKTLKLESSQTEAIKMLLSKTYLRRFLIVFFVLAGQGFSGIAAMDYYSQAILNQYFNSFTSSMYIIGCAVLGVLASFAITFFVDKLGRKFFLISSQLGVSFSCLMIVIGSIFNIKNLVLLGVVLVRITYGLGLAGVPFVIASEFFPTYLVAGGNGLVMAACWLSHFVVGASFVYLKDLLQNYVFLVYTITNLAIAITTYLIVPETKGKSLEEIDELFTKNK